MFDDWSKPHLCQLLVSEGYELRNEAAADTEVVRRHCKRIFKGQNPPRPSELKAEDALFRHSIVLKFQNLWFHYKQADNEAKMAQKAAEHALFHPHAGHGASHEEGSPDNFANYKKQHNAHYSKNLNRGASADEEAGKSLEDKKQALDDHLDQDWEAPTIQRAEAYLDLMHPRMGGRKGINFPLLTSTGRHCTQGSCGEQLDIFDEGQVSELSQFGPGIVLYFKFLKWGFWMFVTLTFVYLPLIIINSYGEGIADATGFSLLATTTIGNLGTSFSLILA